jgi:hypothetical protein
MKTNIVGMETNMEQLLDKACAKFLIFVLVEICPFNCLLCECHCLRFYQFIADNDCAIKKWWSEHFSFREERTYREIASHTQPSSKSSGTQKPLFLAWSYICWWKHDCCGFWEIFELTLNRILGGLENVPCQICRIGTLLRQCYLSILFLTCYLTFNWCATIYGVELWAGCISVSCQLTVIIMYMQHFCFKRVSQ